MDESRPAGGHISGSRLARLLGAWRGDRASAADLAAGIRLLVLDGGLAPATRLPAERELAGALGVSRTLVTAAFRQLRESGLVASRQGSGSWIAVPDGGRPAAGVPWWHAGPDVIDLALAASKPVSGLHEAFDAVRLRLGGELPEHGYLSQGLPSLRRNIARRYTERGLPTDPDQIVITNGAHHAFVIVLRLLAGPGDRVLVEQPSYPNALEAIRLAHALPVPVPLEPDGWNVTAIEAAVRQSAPRLAYLNVDFHNPTGLRLDTDGRRRLATVLRRTRTPVVVDETMAELDLDGEPLDGPPPVAAFAPDWVITVGSASKSHWGGLRLGWIRASGETVQRLVAARTMIDLGSPVFEQLVLGELLDDVDARLRRRRRELAAQRDALIDEVGARLPDWEFHRPAGGLCLWCRLPQPMSTRIAVVAPNHGLRVVPGSRFGAHGGLERWLRLPYAQPPDVLREAVRRLATAAAVAGAAGAGEQDAMPVA